MRKTSVLKYIRKMKAKDVQEVMNAVHDRYRELYPDWELYFFSLERCAGEERRRKFEEIMEFAFRHGV